VSNMANDSDTGFIALAAMRYAIGRRSTGPSIVADWLRRNWREIPENDRAIIQRELGNAIETAIARPGDKVLGDKCDERTWRNLYVWMRERANKGADRD
jgi:hypothetical protein